MSEYTMTLEEAYELTGGSYEIVDGKTILSGGTIGLEHYPIFDEDYRATLNGHIFDHYRLDEIGFENLSVFVMKMRSRMNVIMPYFNKLYNIEKLNIDPLSTINITTTGKTDFDNVTTGESVTDRDISVLGDVDTTLESAETTQGAVDSNVDTSQATNRNSEAQTNSESGTGSRAVNSTTPQVMLSGNKDYASSASDSNAQAHATNTVEEETTETVTGQTITGETTSVSNDTSSTSNAHTDTTTDEQVHTTDEASSTGVTNTESVTSGYQGHSSALLEAYRNSLLNIDMMVIEELSTLFLKVWGTNQPYRGY